MPWLDHGMCLTIFIAVHSMWLIHTDHANGAWDPFGPYPRLGPSYKPKEVIEQQKREKKERERLQGNPA